jgi:hypothetical protein
MTDHELHLGESTIWGHALPRPAGGDGILGTVRVLEQATPERLRVVRRHLPQIDAEELTKTGARRFVDRDGREWRIPHGYIDWFQPSPVEAFAVIDQCIVPLAPSDVEESFTSVAIGEMRGGRVAS